MAGLDLDINPFSGSDPFGPNEFGLSGRRGSSSQAAAYRQPLKPEEFKSVGQKALDTGASGLSYVLGTLDKPGQAVRGALAGKGVSALKNLIPFSDSLGITGESDKTTGRDLTNLAGLTSKNDKGWGAWGAGLAADIATDPLTYMTFGAKSAMTGAGKAVQKTGALRGWTGRQMLEGFHGVEPTLKAAGSTASDLQHMGDLGRRLASQESADAVTKAGLGSLQANQPLSGLVRIGVPFGPSTAFGTGKTAQNIAGALDTAGDYLKFGNPVGRAVGSLFDSTRHGAVDKITQKGAAKYLDPALQTLKQRGRDERFGLIRELDPLVSAGGHTERAINDAARAVAEEVPHSFDPALTAATKTAAAHVRSVHGTQLAEARAAGAGLKDVSDDYAKYVHRSAFPENPANLQVGGNPSNMLPLTSGANIGRDEIFRDIPGGTNRLNDWFDRFAGVPKRKAATANAIKVDMIDDLTRGGGQLTPNIEQQFGDKAAALAERLAVANPAYRSQSATATTDAIQGKPFFSPDLTSDFTQRGMQHANTIANAKAATGILAENARRKTAGDSLVSLDVLARKLGLRTTPADKVAGTPIEGALVNLFRGLAPHGVGKVDPYLMGGTRKLRKQVAQFGVTPEHAEQITKAYGKWTAPEQIKSSLGAFDSATNAFKALAYPIWIPAHVRNAMTAATNNAREGVGIPQYLRQLKVMTGRGKADLSGVHPSLAGLAPDQQIEAIRRMQYGSGNIFGGHGMNEEIAGNAKQAIDSGKRFTPSVPGSDRVGAHGNLAADTADLVINQGLLGSLGATGRAIGGSVKGLLDPSRKWGQSFAENLGIKGVGGAAADTLPAVKAGRMAGTNIEDFFRGSQWLKQVEGGASPEFAADAVNKLHFDYDALTGFEKNVMRRAMPFYTFARRNLPLQLDTAVHTPGVINAQYKPFRQPTPGEERPYVPAYLDSGVSIPTGPEVDGKRQFVSKLGLPAEEAFEKIHFKNGLPDVKRTALDYMGQLNPLIKAPLEQLFNTQFHTQRKLSDLQAPQTASAIGRLFGDDNPQLLGQIMSNSPLTRFFTSADKLTDPRKTWGQKLINLGTGVRVTDVDVDKQRAIDTRNALNEILGEQPNLSQYSSFYVKPEDLDKLSPEEVELMRAYATQQAQAKEYAKRQRVGIRQIRSGE
ncbi:hypothetical protein SAMN05444166_4247 [Singulisphaera sp. GP187]|uniref:hypothetical protein n=1 Tax=Singulisphaera sp. GP187 TaxID=1882752 RepID=UPI00092659D9|nr:hypothetical protein [Singulisphaera sp. GP187]SIO38181.1 hypothetical protein SAMN05444166_4247 [Singulisphaera sp. GP187]